MLTAAFNWYRALGGELTALDIAGEIRQPVLYVYGRRDMPVFVRDEVVERVPEFATGPYRSVALDAGHWWMQEERERVVSEVMTHLLASADGG